MASLIGVKDITDITGDAKIGYRSLWVSIVYNHAAWVIVSLVTGPFLVLALLVLVGALPFRFIALTLFWPVAIAFVRCSALATEASQQQAIREFFYHFWFACQLVGFVLYVPSLPMYVVAAAATTYWLCTSQRLHWSGGIRVWKARALLALLRLSVQSRVRFSGVVRERSE
jgi:4-hydroxybenzoate polyprenyltransferase